MTTSRITNGKAYKEYHVIDKTSDVPSYLYESGQFGHDEACAKVFDSIKDALMYIKTNSISDWATVKSTAGRPFTLKRTNMTLSRQHRESLVEKLIQSKRL